MLYVMRCNEELQGKNTVMTFSVVILHVFCKGGVLHNLIGASPDAKVFSAKEHIFEGLAEYKAPIHQVQPNIFLYLFCAVAYM